VSEVVLDNASSEVGERLSLEEASGSRIPVKPQDRAYTGFGNILFTGIAMGSASYGYLVGTSLSLLGTTWIVLLGYALGLVIGTATIALAAGFISFRLGIDSVDASKVALGIRGSSLVVLGIIAVPLAWANITLAMTAVGIGSLVHTTSSYLLRGSWIVPAVGVSIVLILHILLRKGAQMIERVTVYSSVIQIAVVSVVLYIIATKFGMGHAFKANGASEPLAGDRLLQLAYGVEYGVINALALLPTIGGFARLTQHRRHLAAPWVIGYGLIGCMLPTIAGALAAVLTHSDELSEYIVGIAGTLVGTVLLILIQIANLGTLLVNLFVGALGLQQVSAFARLHWRHVVTLVMIPCLGAAFCAHWLLTQVMAILAYGGVIFVGITAVVGIDYLVLRKQKVYLEHIFVPTPKSKYWFWGGFNLVALGVIAGSCGMYLWLFDPVTLRIHGPFRWLGASIPSAASAAITYYVLMRLLMVRSRKGGYRAKDLPAGETLEVRL
jgi:purine-cytosine permease-like protein